MMTLGLRLFLLSLLASAFAGCDEQYAGTPDGNRLHLYTVNDAWFNIAIAHDVQDAGLRRHEGNGGLDQGMSGVHSWPCNPPSFSYVKLVFRRVNEHGATGPVLALFEERDLSCYDAYCLVFTAEARLVVSTKSRYNDPCPS